MNKSAQKQDHWRNEIAVWLASGQTQRAWCVARDLNVHTFAYWRRRVGDVGALAAAQIVPVQVAQTPAAIVGSVVECGAAIRIALPALSPSALAVLIRLLAAC